MPLSIKYVCDGPQCEKTYDVPKEMADVQSAPPGWLSAVKLRIAPPKQSLPDLPVEGDFCSEACLMAKLKERRANGWRRG